MPTAINAVGPLELPLDPGPINTAIDDPVVTGLLDYLAFWLRASLNAKLANLHGTSGDAAPVKNRFPWDPATYFVRGRQDGAASPFPALYVWWTGKSTTVPYSILKEARMRTIGVCWIFDELTLPGALEDRHGLRAAVDAVISTAISLGHHPAYGLNGARPGSPLAVSLNLCAHGMRYDGGTQGLMAAIPGTGAANAGLAAGRDTGHVVRAYPTLQGMIQVWERVEQFAPADPGDVAPEILATVATNGEGSVDDAETVFRRYLLAPDGSEDIEP